MSLRLTFLLTLLATWGCAERTPPITRPLRGEPVGTAMHGLAGRWVERAQHALVVNEDGTATLHVTGFELREGWIGDRDNGTGGRYATGAVFYGHFAGWSLQVDSVTFVMPDTVCVQPEFGAMVTFIPQHASEYDTLDALVGHATLWTGGGPWVERRYIVPIRATKETKGE